jgi:hypothetical protein
VPTKDEFESAIKEAGEMAREIGGELEGKIEGEVVDGTEVHGYECKYKAQTYSIYGSPENKYMTLHSDTHMTEIIMGLYGINSEKASQKLNDITENYISEDRKGETNYNLSKLLRTADIVHTYTTHNEVAYYFTLKSKIFPYRVNYDISDFNECVMTVVETANMGAHYLQREYGVYDDIMGEDDDKKDDKGFF